MSSSRYVNALAPSGRCAARTRSDAMPLHWSQHIRRLTTRWSRRPGPAHAGRRVPARRVYAGATRRGSVEALYRQVRTLIGLCLATLEGICHFIMCHARPTCSSGPHPSAIHVVRNAAVSRRGTSASSAARRRTSQLMTTISLPPHHVRRLAASAIVNARSGRVVVHARPSAQVSRRNSGRPQQTGPLEHRRCRAWLLRAV